MNLATRILLSLLIPVLLCVGAYGVLNVRLRRTEMLDDARRELNDHATSLAVALGAALRDRQIEDVAELVDDLSRADRVFGIMIFDHNDRLVGTSAALRPDVARFSNLGHAARVGASRMASTTTQSGHPVLVYGFALRVRDRDAPSGSALLVRDLAYVEQNVGISATRVALVGAVLALTLIIVGWFGLRSAVLNPLALLLDSVERAGPDSLDSKTTIVRSDEIGRLAIAYNKLLDTLRAARSSLDEQTKTLVSVERRLHHAQRLALVGQLAANLAHKVGSPLNVVLGRARYALQQGGQSERDQKHLREIIAGAESISSVIEQLLAHARKGRGVAAEVSVSEVAQSVASFLEIEASQRGVALTVQLDASLQVTAIRSEIEQIFLNLMMNALQAQPQGGALRVTVARSSAQPEAIELRVEDAGPGIQETDRARVFEPFFTTKPSGEGTGLGLTICEEITQRLGGTIAATTSSLGGACFTVTLPLKRKASP